MNDADRYGTEYRFRLGDIQVTTLLDGAVRRDSVKPPFCMDWEPEAVAALAAENRLPADRMEHPFVPVLFETGGQRVLVDAGFGSGGPGPAVGHLRARLAAVGVDPGDVDVVMLTHVHPDHILGLSEGGVPCFPKARYAIGRREFDRWRSGEGIPEARAENRAMFLDRVVPLAERMTFLEDGDAVAPGITAEAAYGHSAGHMMLRVESGGRQLLHWGDVTNHYVFSLQAPEARVMFDDDPEAATATRLRVLDMAAADAIPVIGYHMPFPSVGYVLRLGGRYRWEAASYQLRV